MTTAVTAIGTPEPPLTAARADPAPAPGPAGPVVPVPVEARRRGPEDGEVDRGRGGAEDEHEAEVADRPVGSTQWRTAAQAAPRATDTASARGSRAGARAWPVRRARPAPRTAAPIR